MYLTIALQGFIESYHIDRNLTVLTSLYRYNTTIHIPTFWFCFPKHIWLCNQKGFRKWVNKNHLYDSAHLAMHCGAAINDSLLAGKQSYGEIVSCEGCLLIHGNVFLIICRFPLNHKYGMCV